MAFLSVVTLSRHDSLFHFLSAEALRLSLKLPKFPSYCDTLKWSPAVLNNIPKAPRICIVCSARKSSCCRNWAGSSPELGHPLQLCGVAPHAGDTATAACQPVAAPLCACRSVTHTDEDSLLSRFKVRVSGVGRKWRLCSIKTMSSSC